ncbi:DUF4062 domain-containing protein [Aliarcobacter skirrowii]|uniref:ankyrin repeat domain-containing protein n=1 Tax=Aliarcobacter skirrowii TaxID=28200 RepID=UPI000F67BF4F|nr:ankyrin repeat domain-containing protein [Aliarcobacter skirrowii]AZL54168.1 DUF4062 domain-containing protein [Aliarcobacter skirrowii]
MNQSKTFRLFVSSTFSDFSVERRLLQEYVFPEIKKYCNENNFNFQPIDLRWGVSNEAQLDQKTLELCLEEVRTSKINPHPNFLIMIGDRYGWIPLPYLIEKSEYETILSNIEKTKDIELLNNWYKLDENQIPASYILKERENKFANDKVWEKLENHLRAILQNSVIKSSLSKENKERYFMSATEHEVVEGIFKYLNITPSQEIILQKNKAFLEIDSKNVYAYIRNIKSIKEKFKNDFIDNNLENVSKFKKGIKEAIENNNILEVDIELNISEDNINKSFSYDYETILNEQNSIFVKTMISNLKKSINTYKNSIKDLSDDIEFLEHKNFKNLKIKNFFGKNESLKKIDEYINSDDTKPLIVYGKSGYGKSSLMAKAICDAENKYKDQTIVYRFIGATSNSVNIRSLLISIVNQLKNSNIIKVIPEYNNLDKKFFEQIKKILSELKKPIIIFIDALDQIQKNEDNNLINWIPNELRNLKLIVSTLCDENYSKDNNPFNLLKKKYISDEKLYLDISNESLDKADDITIKVLNSENRLLQEEQKKYILSKFEQSNCSPLFLILSLYEAKSWKSYCKNTELPKDELELIKKFISNLSEINHFDSNFIKKIFGYIYVSRHGLSEIEILEILSEDLQDDPELQKTILNEYHLPIKEKNLRRGDKYELIFPISILSRFYYLLKPFLIKRLIDNQELIQFYHRQFNKAVSYHIEDNQFKLYEKLFMYFKSLRNVNKEYDLRSLSEIPHLLFKIKRILSHPNTIVDKSSKNFYKDNIKIIDNEFISQYLIKKSSGELKHYLTLLKIFDKKEHKNLIEYRQIENRKYPLHIASYNDDYFSMSILLKKGFDPNELDNKKNLPLHYVGKKETAKLLIDHGAKININNSSLMYSPLSSAIYDECYELAEYLLEQGAEYDFRDLHYLVNKKIDKKYKELNKIIYNYEFSNDKIENSNNKLLECIKNALPEDSNLLNGINKFDNFTLIWSTNTHNSLAPIKNQFWENLSNINLRKPNFFIISSYAGFELQKKENKSFDFFNKEEIEIKVNDLTLKIIVFDTTKSKFHLKGYGIFIEENNNKIFELIKECECKIEYICASDAYIGLSKGGTRPLDEVIYDNTSLIDLFIENINICPKIWIQNNNFILPFKKFYEYSKKNIKINFYIFFREIIELYNRREK